MSAFTERLSTALAPNYDLGEELPGGGMSRVFIATERALGRRVVVKVLPPELAAGVNRERFRREIQLAASLQHPHVVPLLAAGEDGELLYYTMPFIDGESLRDRLTRGERLGVREVVRMLHDVVDALSYAHTRGVVHRDIKPGNILTQGGHALVTDFGVAKAISAALPGTGMTTTGMAIGTPAYMAPEQLAADPAADHRVDLYAVGLLAYELLTGASPFASKSPTETMAAQFTRDPPPLETVRRDVPPQLASLVRRLLAKSPEARPATAAQVRDALESIPLSDGPITPTDSFPAVRPRRFRTAAIVALVAAGLLAAAVAGAVYSSWQIQSVLFPDPDEEIAVAVGDSLSLDDSPPAVVLPDVPATAPSDTAGEPRRLTRADSIAIAEAVRAELARAGRATPPPAAPAQGEAQRRRAASGGSEGSEGSEAEALDRRLAIAERLTARIDRQLADSLLRSSMAEVSRTVPLNFEFRNTQPAPAAPSTPGAAPSPRVYVADTTGATSVRVLTSLGGPPPVWTAPRRVLLTASAARTPALAKTSADVARAFRALLGGERLYAPVSPEEAQQAFGETQSVARAAEQLRAELVTTLDLVALPGDSVVLIVKLHDLTAIPPFAYRVAASGTVARSDFERVLPVTLQAALDHLNAMSRAPRRRAASR